MININEDDVRSNYNDILKRYEDIKSSLVRKHSCEVAFCRRKISVYREILGIE